MNSRWFASSRLAGTVACLGLLAWGCGGGSSSGGGASSAGSANWTHPVVNVMPDGSKQDAGYQPIAVSDVHKKWNLCVSFPHMKDSYWLGADYGVVEEARRDNIHMQLYEAGGYTNLNTQLSQIDNCVAQGSDAVILGAISAKGVNAKVEEIVAKGIPVIDFVNGIDTPKVSAHALVSFFDMGAAAGDYLKKQAAGKPLKVAFFPGPQGAGWTDTALEGFQKKTEGSGIQVVAVKWGDTGKDVQLKLLEDTLQAYADIDYVVGNAVLADAAVGELQSRQNTKTKVLSFYIIPQVYEEIVKGQVAGAPTDYTAIQGRMAVDMAVRLLEKKSLPTTRSGPKITVVSKDSLGDFKYDDTFGPKDFKPTFKV